MEKQRKRLEEYLNQKQNEKRHDDMKEQDLMSKRLKIEKRKQVNHEQQKRMLQEYHDKKKQTENLLRISDQNPDIQEDQQQDFKFTNSYMKKRVLKNSHSKNKKSNNKSQNYGVPAHDEVADTESKLGEEAEVKIDEQPQDIEYDENEQVKEDA